MTEEKKDDKGKEASSKEAVSSSVFDASAGKEKPTSSPEVERKEGASENPGRSDAGRGSDNTPQPSKIITVPQNVYKFMGASEATERYVKMCMRYAAKGKLSVPKGLASMDMTIIEDKVLLWILQGKRGTNVQFVFVTADGITVKIQEQMEVASSARLMQAERDVKEFLLIKRGERDHPHWIH